MATESERQEAPTERLPIVKAKLSKTPKPKAKAAPGAKRRKPAA